MTAGTPSGHRPGGELPAARSCLDAALAIETERPREALGWLRRLGDDTGDFTAWKGAVALLDRHAALAADMSKRHVRLAVLGSYTTDQLTELLRLSAFRFGVHVATYQAGFDQYRQEILDERSGLYAFDPDVVLIAVHEGVLDLPTLSPAPDGAVAAAADDWTELWRLIRERSGARIIQHNFVTRLDGVLGHLAAGLPEARNSMITDLNRRLGERAAAGVSLVDCEAISAHLGKAIWFDDRYWHLSKQAVSLAALPTLARHTAAVLAAQLGLTRKVLVLDLDDTLWGGTIGDDGLDGIVLGSGSAAGEAFVAFQRYCKALADRGILLAVCSKNDGAIARLPFRDHPAMELAEDDIAMFVANWLPKPDNLRTIADRLNLGLDALVFVDDNPAEREIVRQLVPEVEVLPISPDPAARVAEVAGSLLFEPAAITDEDRDRTARYRALVEAEDLRSESPTLESFYRGLGMRAYLAPINDVDLARVVQLLGKTNQFNLTTRRHGDEAVRRFMADPDTVHFTVRLEDRLADHGLIAVVIATTDGDALDIDTWAMSCRVIGRTVERTILAELVAEAQHRGLDEIRGTYLPTDRNGLVADLYPDLGFERVASSAARSTWLLPLPDVAPYNEFIATVVAA